MALCSFGNVFRAAALIVGNLFVQGARLRTSMTHRPPAIVKRRDSLPKGSPQRHREGEKREIADCWNDVPMRPELVKRPRLSGPSKKHARSPSSLRLCVSVVNFFSLRV